MKCLLPILLSLLLFSCASSKNTSEKTSIFGGSGGKGGEGKVSNGKTGKDGKIGFSKEQN